MRRASPFQQFPNPKLPVYVGEKAVITAVTKPGCYVQWFCAGIPINTSSSGYTLHESGNTSDLIIDRVSESDLTFFACESRGETRFVTLEQKSPFRGTLQDAFGRPNGIAVFEVQTFNREDVDWFVGKTQITSDNFSMLKYEIRKE